MTPAMLTERALAISITPNRTEVSRNFPVLGFTVRTGKSPSWFEVALATDPRLFQPAAAGERTPQNFWSSAELGPVAAPQGEAVFLTPAAVLSGFAGAGQVFFAVACFASTDKRQPQVWTPDPAAAPSVGISASFTGHRRVSLDRSHNGNGNGNGNYGTQPPERLAWAGDTAAPGIETPGPNPAPAPGPTNGSTNGAPTSGAPTNGAPTNTNTNTNPGNTTAPNSQAPAGNPTNPATGEDKEMKMNGSAEMLYDDGLDEAFWTSQQLQMSESGRNDDPDAYGIEGPVPPEYQHVSNGNGHAVAAGAPAHAMTAPEYPQASRFVRAATGNYQSRSAPRTINRIVIHITDGGANISGPISWFQNPDAKVSSHYIIGQDGEVVQMVRHNDIAYHARGGNSHSIGIEHVANTRGLAYTESQYVQSAGLVSWLCDTFGIPKDREHILGHREAVETTKTCPGDFDWDYFMGMVTTSTSYPRSEHDAGPAGAMGRAGALGGARNMGAAAQGIAPRNNGASHAHAAPIAPAIAGAVITRVLSNNGDIEWKLDQMNGKKRPGDDPAKEGSPEYVYPETTLNIPGPSVIQGGIDKIQAEIQIKFEHNGRTVANVAQAVTAPNDALGAGLKVVSTIHDVAREFPSASDPNSYAAVRIQITYNFTNPILNDAVYIKEVTLYGNGTHDDTGRWTVRP